MDEKEFVKPSIKDTNTDGTANSEDGPYFTVFRGMVQDLKARLTINTSVSMYKEKGDDKK